MASRDKNNVTNTWELSLYEFNRSPQEVVTDNTEIAVSPESLHDKLMCPICLQLLKKTMTAKACLHRFCSECIVTALRSGNKECPTCRKKLPTKRSLRADPNFDIIISILYPNRDEYEAHQTSVLEKLNSSNSQANLVQSVNEGIKLQTQNRLKRNKKNQHKEKNEGSCSAASKPSSSTSQSSDNLTTTTVQTKGAKNIKSDMFSKKEGPTVSTVDTSDIPECESSSKSVQDDEIELVLKPHPTKITSDKQMIRILRENSVRYIKTTPSATVEHLSKYLAMRSAIELGTEFQEQEHSFLIYIAPTKDEFVFLNGNLTLQNVHKKFWKVNKPLEMFYSIN